VNILIGYANSLSRDFAQNHLASSDTSINVLTCGTVKECLDILHDNLNISMIGLDMDMPDMNGLAGFERVREACLHPVPIALIGPMVKRPNYPRYVACKSIWISNLLDEFRCHFECH